MRLPGKPLADIAGRPMVEHVYRRAASARGVDAVVVATDDERIAAAVAPFTDGSVSTTEQPERSNRSNTTSVASMRYPAVQSI